MQAYRTDWRTSRNRLNISTKNTNTVVHAWSKTPSLQFAIAASPRSLTDDTYAPFLKLKGVQARPCMVSG